MVALRNLVSANIVDEYPPLADIRGSYVAQVRFLFCVYANLRTHKKTSSLCVHPRAPQPRSSSSTSTRFCFVRRARR